jgi:TRAP transporter TAXI family solute receptor
VAIATDNCGAQIIDLNSNVEKALVAKYPYYAFATIPQGTYKTNRKHVTTFGVMATLVTRSSMNSQVVYELTRSVMENMKSFKKLHPAFRTLTRKKMAKDGLSAPMHRGAVKYFKEKGLL